MAVLVSTKKTKTVDFELCLICQTGGKKTDYRNYVLTPSLVSVEKLITITETEFSSLRNRIKGLSAD